MGFQKDVYGVSFGFLWCLCGISMGILWDVHEISLDFYGISMRLLLGY